MYHVMYLQWQYHIEWFCHSKNPLCSAHSSLPPLWPLETIDTFKVSIALPFPACHVAGIIEYVVFRHWPLSLNMFKIPSLFFFLHRMIFHHLYIPQFIYLFTHWRISAVVNVLDFGHSNSGISWFPNNMLNILLYV